MDTTFKHFLGYTGAACAGMLLGAAAMTSSDATGTETAAATHTVTAKVTTTPTKAGGAAAPATVTVTKAASAPTTSKAPKTTSSTAKASIPGDGTYEVGVDIKAGTYESKPPASGNCYWARLNSPDGFDGIIANNNSSGQSLVTIRATDKFFQTSGCETWAAR